MNVAVWDRASLWSGLEGDYVGFIVQIYRFLPLLSNKIIEFLGLSKTENIQNISTRSDHKSYIIILIENLETSQLFLQWEGGCLACLLLASPLPVIEKFLGNTAASLVTAGFLSAKISFLANMRALLCAFATETLLFKKMRDLIFYLKLC